MYLLDMFSLTLKCIIIRIAMVYVIDGQVRAMLQIAEEFSGG